MELSAEERWTEHRDRLLAELGDTNAVVVEILGWQPVDLEEGLRWLKASHYEAFKVDHELIRAENETVTRVRSWEDWGG